MYFTFWNFEDNLSYVRESFIHFRDFFVCTIFREGKFGPQTDFSLWNNNIFYLHSMNVILMRNILKIRAWKRGQKTAAWFGCLICRKQPPLGVADYPYLFSSGNDREIKLVSHELHLRVLIRRWIGHLCWPSLIFLAEDCSLLHENDPDSLFQLFILLQITDYFIQQHFHYIQKIVFRLSIFLHFRENCILIPFTLQPENQQKTNPLTSPSRKIDLRFVVNNFLGFSLMF